jgi:hypothetical protein
MVRSSRGESQPDSVFANGIGSDKAERRPGAGEVRLAAAKHERTVVEVILVDKTEVAKAPRQLGPCDVDIELWLNLGDDGLREAAYRGG